MEGVGGLTHGEGGEREDEIYEIDEDEENCLYSDHELINGAGGKWKHLLNTELTLLTER